MADEDLALYAGDMEADDVLQILSERLIDRNTVGEGGDEPFAEGCDGLTVGGHILRTFFSRRSHSGDSADVFGAGAESVLLSAAEDHRLQAFVKDKLLTAPECADALRCADLMTAYRDEVGVQL